MAKDRWQPGRLILSLAIVGVAAAAIILAARRGREPPWVEHDLPPASTDSPKPPAFVGSGACFECHEEQTKSYRTTAHSRALSEVVASSEPAAGSLTHTVSGRQLTARTEGTRLVHRQELLGEGAPVVEERSLKLLVGSGRHSRTYLIEDDGFLAESPLTWYESKRAWRMSPGYDRAGHDGFERAADLGCLVCHLGRAESVGESASRLKLHELAIGCENCHGPGAEHVATHSASSTVKGAMVHPGRLSRELAEAVCAACHLRGDATVYRPGKSFADVRPGRRLTEARIDYFLQTDADQMKVVGHVEQMRLSACWKKSSLTCTTCHDPHSTRRPEQQAQHYQETCLSCHTCGLDQDLRRKSQPDDRCAACHMPSSETDIPHIAFTHHRIGIHEKPTSTPQVPAIRLSAIELPQDMSPAEEQRNLGLALLEVSDRGLGPATFRDAAWQHLQSALGHGLRDGPLLSAAARLAWERNDSQAEPLAERALADPHLPAGSRLNALIVTGDLRWRAGDLEPALTAFRRLTEVRRHSEDWHTLAALQAEQGHLDLARRSWERAIAIQPFREDLRRAFAEHLRRMGEDEPARREEAVADRLRDAFRPDSLRITP